MLIFLFSFSFDVSGSLRHSTSSVLGSHTPRAGSSAGGTRHRDAWDSQSLDSRLAAITTTSNTGRRSGHATPHPHPYEDHPVPGNGHSTSLANVVANCLSGEDDEFDMPNPMGTLGSLGRGSALKRPASSATMAPRWTNEEAGVVKRGDVASTFYTDDFCDRSHSQMGGKFYPGPSDWDHQVPQQVTASSLKRPGSSNRVGSGMWGGVGAVPDPQSGAGQTVCDLDYCPDLIIQHPGNGIAGVNGGPMVNHQQGDFHHHPGVGPGNGHRSRAQSFRDQVGY